MASPFVELLADLAESLAGLNVEWYLFGAQAAGLYGSARVTADVDVTVRLGGLDPAALKDALSAAGFELRVDDDDFVARTRVLPVVHARTGVPADLVIAGPGLEDLFFERVRTVDFFGVDVPVAAAEDIVVMKLLAGRPKDIEDVEGILAACADDMDLGLVRDTVAMLEEALDQGDLSPALEQALARSRQGGEGG
jgi:hypothetical protein